MANKQALADWLDILAGWSIPVTVWGFGKLCGWLVEQLPHKHFWPERFLLELFWFLSVPALVIATSVLLYRLSRIVRRRATQSVAVTRMDEA